jgi:hypothetical protein
MAHTTRTFCPAWSACQKFAIGRQCEGNVVGLIAVGSLSGIRGAIGLRHCTLGEQYFSGVEKFTTVLHEKTA